MALSRVLSPLLFPPPSSLPHPRLFTRALSVSASISAPNSGDQIEVAAPKSQRRWKPMCLYYTQDKCTMMNDRLHFEKFSHSYLMDLEVNASEVYNLRPQNLDYFLVLDLEGKVEILEFPVVMIDAKTMRFIDSFHRFVRPCKMSEQRITEYIEGKYGKLGVEQVWHDTSILFKDVLHDFEIWMAKHHLWNEELPGALHRAAFVTCGNWDLKTKVPQQCKDSSMKIPPYFMEWINLKDIYLNFYKRRAPGMMTMMRELGIPSVGSHHLGIDDTKNIARVLQRLLADGAIMQITARRNSSDLDSIQRRPASSRHPNGEMN